MTTPRQHLTKHMEARQQDLGDTWDTIAARGLTNAETLRQVRRGDRPIRRTTQRAVEAGLLWAEGSVAAILAGGDPAPLTQTATTTGMGESLLAGGDDLADLIDAVLAVDGRGMAPAMKLDRIAAAVADYRRWRARAADHAQRAAKHPA